MTALSAAPPTTAETARAGSVTRPPRWRRRPSTAGVLTILALVAVTFVFMTPVIWAAMAATKPTQIAFTTPPQFTYTPTGKAFVDLWQGTDFYRYLVNTLVVAVSSVVATLLLAAPAAYALSRFGGRTSAIILAVALLFRATPGFALALPLYQLANRAGIYDTRLALAMALVAIDQPFSIWLLRNFFAEIPRELDEAALIDGCTRWGALRRIILPLMAPGLITAAVLTFLLSFQQYLLPVVLTDVNSKTVPVFLASQIGQTLPLLQQGAAGIMLITVPIVVLAFVAQRYLVSGLTNGSVKG